MRKRKWVLFAFIFMLAFIFFSLESWQLFRANEKLKEFILKEFRPIVGEQLHISKVHVSFGNIHILDVRFLLPENNISIDIRDLRIGYNFFYLLSRGFDPQYISRDALFIGPTITIKAPADSAIVSNAPQTGEEVKIPLDLSSEVKELDMFSHITLRDGEIVYAKNDSTIFTLVHSVQGGIYRQKADSLFVHMDGSFFNSKEQNINIVGTGLFRTQRISGLQARLSGYDLAHGLPLLDKKIIDINQGELAGEIDVHWDEGQNRYVTSGDLTIQNGAGHLFDNKIALTDIVADLALLNDQIRIKESHQKVNNSYVQITGLLEDLHRPHLDIEVESKNFELGEFMPVLGEEYAGFISGQSTLRATVTGPLDRLVVRNSLSSRAVRIKNLLLQKFYADVIYTGGSVVVDSSTANIQNNHVWMSGAIDLSSTKRAISGALSGSGDLRSLLASLKIDPLVTLPATLHAAIFGTLKEPVFSGALGALIQTPQDTLAINAPFLWQNRQLSFLFHPRDNFAAFDASIDWRQSPAAIRLLCQRPEQLARLLWCKSTSFLPVDLFRSTLSVLGNLARFTVTSDIVALSDGVPDGRLLNLTAAVDWQKANLASDGAFTLFPDADITTTGSFQLEKDLTAFHLTKFELNKELQGHLSIGLDKIKNISGAFVATAMDVGRIAGNSAPALAGFVDLNFAVAGTVPAPQLTGDIHLDGLQYQDAGPYESFINFNYDTTGFDLEKFMLNFGKSTLLFANGRYAAAGQNLNFAVKGAGFDAGHVLGAAGKDSLLTGETLVDLSLTGPARTPIVRGLVALQNGKILDIPFDEIELQLGPDESEIAAAERPVVHINSFRLSRFNFYEILAHGFYPLRASDSLYMDVNGQGNFLQVLSDVDRFFKSPTSICTLQGRVRGTPASPLLQQARLTIDDATMGFGSVIPAISDVHAEVSFDSDDQFLSLPVLEGQMGNKRFRIHNELASDIHAAKPLQDIHIGDSDFHFGVLVLETPQKGVPLNFVGLMEPKEFGHLELVGRQPGEKFYFAGLPDGLTLRGRINLYDTEIMYPFYPTKSGGSPKVKEFLQNLDWDVLVVPTKNTRFVRNFAGAIDEIYVDLKLDEGFGGLEFTDRLEDDSFRINGQVRSTKGMLEYLDMNFRVEQAGVEFDRSSLVPVAYGSAKTTVTDSLGISSNILLTLQTVDNTMDKKSVDDIVRQEEGRARFDRFRFKLSSDNPNIGGSEAQIIASLGYSANDLQNSALSAIGYGTDNLIFRPLFRPVEKELEQTFGFDYVRFSSQLTRNIIMFNLNDNLELNSRLALLESTKIIVGKYLANRFFLQYTGQLESGVGYRYKQKHLGLHHTFGLEYQINPQVLVELEYDYDSLMLQNRDDKRIVLRHWFPF